MEYLLLICADDDFQPTATMGPDTEAWATDVDDRGIRKLGDRLRPPADATTVRVRDGETLITDGPFAETKEFIVGFDLLECADLDEAIAVAAAHPMATAGTVEVRPVWPFDG